MGYLISETDEQGNLIKDYIWQEGMTPVAQIDNNAGTESIVYLYTDHLMTNRLATDDTQSIVWSWEGEAFGNTPAEELAGTTINLRFPGQYYDSETNLHYNHFRYYDPNLGRYITSDPIGLMAGMNTYSYTGQNPVVRYDSNGQAWQTIWVWVGGIYVGYKVWVEFCEFVDKAEESKEKRDEAWEKISDGDLDGFETLTEADALLLDAAREGVDFGVSVPGTTAKPNIPGVRRK